MEKEFTPYEESLELKELEFDEPCFGKYLSSAQSNWKVYELILEMGMNEEFEDNRNVYFLDGACSAPTFSQVFRWFREKHNIDGFVQIEPLNKKYGYVTYDRKRENYIESERKYTVEEAELACLKQLIKIVKNGK